MVSRGNLRNEDTSFSEDALSYTICSRRRERAIPIPQQLSNPPLVVILVVVGRPGLINGSLCHVLSGWLIKVFVWRVLTRMIRLMWCPLYTCTVSPFLSLSLSLSPSLPLSLSLSVCLCVYFGMYYRCLLRHLIALHNYHRYTFIVLTWKL